MRQQTKKCKNKPVFGALERAVVVRSFGGLLVCTAGLLVALGSATAAQAQTQTHTQRGTWFMHTGGFSHHFQQTQAKGREWRETHPGLGIEYRASSDNDWKLRTSGGLMQDSRGFLGTYAGAAYVREQRWGGGVDTAFGVGGFALYRSTSWSGKRTLVPALMPTASMSFADGRVGINLTYVPKISALNNAMPSVAYAQMVFKIR